MFRGAIGVSKSAKLGVQGLRQGLYADLGPPYPSSGIGPAAPMTVERFSGASGSGGGENPLNFQVSVNFPSGQALLPGDLVLILASFQPGVNQILQPGDFLAPQDIGLALSDDLSEPYTLIDYQEQFTSYLGAGQNAVASGTWARLVETAQTLNLLTLTSNQLQDHTGSTGYIAQWAAFVWFYCLRPGRMPRKLFSYAALTQTLTFPAIKSNTNRLIVFNNYTTSGVVSTNLNFRNNNDMDRVSPSKENFVPTIVVNAMTSPLWVGNAIII